MICSICGREFGPGTNCQHCGADRVSAGASYNGYSAPSSSSSSGLFIPNDPAPSHSSSANSVCPFCGEVIPADAKYCPVCARPLFAACPKCGNIYPSRYKICPSCGTDREKYSREKAEEEMRRAEEKRQAELQAERERAEEERRRIAREALERERKRKEEEEARKQREFQEKVKIMKRDFLASPVGKDVVSALKQVQKDMLYIVKTKLDEIKNEKVRKGIRNTLIIAFIALIIMIILGATSGCFDTEEEFYNTWYLLLIFPALVLFVGIVASSTGVGRTFPYIDPAFKLTTFKEVLGRKINDLQNGDVKDILKDIHDNPRWLIDYYDTPNWLEETAAASYGRVKGLWTYKN